jgi:hypothetical protein
MSEKPVIRVEVWKRFEKDWRVQMKVGSLSFTFAHGDSPLDAIRRAQDRAAELVRGLADADNRFRNGPTEKIQ